MKPDEIHEAHNLLNTLAALQRFLEQPQVKDGRGQISLIEDVTESGCGIRADVQLPEKEIRNFEERQIEWIAEELREMDVDLDEISS